MCGPTSVAALGMGSQAFGAVYTAMGSRTAARGQQFQYEQQARVADMNARLVEANAENLDFAADMTEFEAADAYSRGAHEEQRLRLGAGQLKGRQRAGLAASGVRLDEGSALNILTDTDVMSEADALLIRQNTSREAAGARIRGAGLRAQAAGTRAEAAAVRAGGAAYRGAASGISPNVAGIGSLLGGATSVADRWYRYVEKRVV